MTAARQTTQSNDANDAESLPCLLNTRIGNDRFHLRRRLGSGGFSVVYLATDLSSPRRRQVAVKCLAHKSSEQRRQNMLEVHLHKRAARLPGVVDIYDTVEENGLLFLILQYCDGGDLFSLITEDRLFAGRDDLIRNAFGQLLETVRGLHSMGIYHRDLKPENVLSTNKGTRLFISDFGLATKHRTSRSFGAGSHFYMTPECITGYYYASPPSYSTCAADIWALAIILINLIAARSPWGCAISTDPSFAQYLCNPLWLRQVLPLSRPVFNFVNNIFFKHGIDITHEELANRFYGITVFTMPSEELAYATKTVRTIAAGHTPPIKPTTIDYFEESEDYDEDENEDNEDADKTLVDISDIVKDLDKIVITDGDSDGSSSDTSSDSDLLITPESVPVMIDNPIRKHLSEFEEPQTIKLRIATKRVTFDLPPRT